MKHAICVLALAACGKSEQTTSTVTLNASGATFQKAAQEVAIEAFQQAHRHIKINYGAGGSGKGRQDFADQVVDFACSDAPYKEADLGKVKGGNGGVVGFLGVEAIITGTAVGDG